MTKTNLNHRDSYPSAEDDGDAVEEEDAGDGGDHDEPEPEEDVDLLVDDVQRQDTESVMSLSGAAGTKLVKTALGDLKQK